MEVPSFIYPAGKDKIGRLWLFDAQARRIFTEEDQSERHKRGYPCKSFHEAKRMVKEEKVP